LRRNPAVPGVLVEDRKLERFAHEPKVADADAVLGICLGDCSDGLIGAAICPAGSSWITSRPAIEPSMASCSPSRTSLQVCGHHPTNRGALPSW
jgi:hypothetical protein